MEDLLISLAKDSPWIALTGFLLFKHFASSERSLEIYQAGANQARIQADSVSSLASSIESMERSLCTLQTTVARSESTMADCQKSVAEIRGLLSAGRG